MFAEALDFSMGNLNNTLTIPGTQTPRGTMLLLVSSYCPYFVYTNYSYVFGLIGKKRLKDYRWTAGEIRLKHDGHISRHNS